MADKYIIERCREYLEKDNFKYRDFFILAQGDLTARQFVNALGVGSTYMVTNTRSSDANRPSLLTVRRMAEYTKVDARKLWLKVCNEIFNEEENFIIHTH